MSENLWYFAQDGKSQGPVSETDLKRMIANRDLSPDVLVWSQGITDGWVPASSTLAPPEPINETSTHEGRISEPASSSAKDIIAGLRARRLNSRPDEQPISGERSPTGSGLNETVPAAPLPAIERAHDDNARPVPSRSDNFVRSSATTGEDPDSLAPQNRSTTSLDSRIRLRRSNVVDSMPWWKTVVLVLSERLPTLLKYLKMIPKKYLVLSAFCLFLYLAFTQIFTPWSGVLTSISIIQEKSRPKISVAPPFNNDSKARSKPQLNTGLEFFVLDLPVEKSENPTSVVFSYARPIVTAITAGALLSILVGAFLIWGLRLHPVIGSVLLVIGITVTVLVSPEVYLSRVVIEKDRFTIREGRWWNPITYDVPLLQLEVVELEDRVYQKFEHSTEIRYRIKPVIKKEATVIELWRVPYEADVAKVKSEKTIPYLVFKTRDCEDEQWVRIGGCISKEAVEAIAQAFRQNYSIRTAEFRLDGFETTDDIKRISDFLGNLKGVINVDMVKLGSGLCEVIYDSKVTDTQMIFEDLKREEGVEISEGRDAIYFVDPNKGFRTHTTTWPDEGAQRCWGIKKHPRSDSEKSGKLIAVFVGDSLQPGMNTARNARIVSNLQSMDGIVFTAFDVSMTTPAAAKEWNLESFDRRRLPCLAVYDADMHKVWARYGPLNESLLKRHLEQMLVKDSPANKYSMKELARSGYERNDDKTPAPEELEFVPKKQKALPPEKPVHKPLARATERVELVTKTIQAHGLTSPESIKVVKENLAMDPNLPAQRFEFKDALQAEFDRMGNRYHVDSTGAVDLELWELRSAEAIFVKDGFVEVKIRH